MAINWTTIGKLQTPLWWTSLASGPEPGAQVMLLQLELGMVRMRQIQQPVLGLLRQPGGRCWVAAKSFWTCSPQQSSMRWHPESSCSWKVPKVPRNISKQFIILTWRALGQQFSKNCQYYMPKDPNKCKTDQTDKTLKNVVPQIWEQRKPSQTNYSNSSLTSSLCILSPPLQSRVSSSFCSFLCFRPSGILSLEWHKCRCQLKMIPNTYPK